MIYIFANEADFSIGLIEKELNKQKIAYKRIKFKNIRIESHTLVLGGQTFNVQKSDRILIRSPFNTPYFTRDYSALARSIVMRYPDQIVFDRDAYRYHLPFYQDKLYQGLYYDYLKIPTPRIWHASNKKNLDQMDVPYPIVVKKRRSSRGRSNFLVNSSTELLAKTGSKKLHEYIFQEYIPAVSDIRLNILNGRVLYAMERAMHTRDGGRLVVHGATPIDPPQKLVHYTKKVAHAIGADFAGIDFLEAKDGSYYLIESNLSPQFNRAEDIFPEKTTRSVLSAITGGKSGQLKD